MSNTCSNNITFVSENIEQLKEIESFFKEIKELKDYRKTSLFNELSDNGKITFDNKYIQVTDSDFFKTVLTITANSDWGPFLELVQRLLMKFTDAKAVYDYDEQGCYFGGRAEIDYAGMIDDRMDYLEYLEKYDEQGFDNELQFKLENDFDGDVEKLKEAYPQYAQYAEELEQYDVE